jgi:hypothetical protein
MPPVDPTAVNAHAEQNVDDVAGVALDYINLLGAATLMTAIFVSICVDGGLGQSAATLLVNSKLGKRG